MSDHLHPWIEPELEARIVALVLGEASDFEREQLERLMAERPELVLFKERIESVHGMLEDLADQPSESEPDVDDAEWKLSSDRRQEVLKTLGISDESPSEQRIPAASSRRGAGQGGNVILLFSKFAAAACLVLGLGWAVLQFAPNGDSSSGTEAAIAFNAPTAPGPLGMTREESTMAEADVSDLYARSSLSSIRDSLAKPVQEGLLQDQKTLEQSWTGGGTMEDLRRRDSERSQQVAEVRNKLRSLDLPEVQLEDAPLPEALAYLTEASKEVDIQPSDEERGVNFVLAASGTEPVEDREPGEFGYDPKGAELAATPIEERRVSLQGRYVSFEEALEEVTSQTRLKYRVEEDGVKIVTLDEPSEVYFTEEYQLPLPLTELAMLQAEARGPVPDDPFAGLEGAVTKSPEPPREKSPQEVLEEAGIAFPKGSTAEELPGNRLIVRNTDSQLDLVEAYTDHLWRDPQVTQWAQGALQFPAAQANGPMVATATAPMRVGRVRSVEDDLIDQQKEKLQEIVLPEVRFDNTPLSEALAQLEAKSRELDPTAPVDGLKGLNIVMRAGLSGGNLGFEGETLDGEEVSVEDTPITLKLTDVPLSEALRYTTELARLKYKVEPHAVAVVPVTELSDDLHTQVFHVPPTYMESWTSSGGGASADPFAALADSDPGSEVLKAKKSAKDIFEEAGVTFPRGSSVTYNESTGQLIVRNTEDQLDLIDAYTSTLGAGTSEMEMAQLYITEPEFPEVGAVMDESGVVSGLDRDSRTFISGGTIGDSKKENTPESYPYFGPGMTNADGENASTDGFAFEISGSDSRAQPEIRLNFGDGQTQIGSGDAHAQLGHGAYLNAEGEAEGGDIMVNAGQAGSYAQVGHGGRDSSGSFSGDISVTTAGDIEVTGMADKQELFEDDDIHGGVSISVDFGEEDMKSSSSSTANTRLGLKTKASLSESKQENQRGRMDEEKPTMDAFGTDYLSTDMTPARDSGDTSEPRQNKERSLSVVEQKVVADMEEVSEVGESLVPQEKGASEMESLLATITPEPAKPATAAPAPAPTAKPKPAPVPEAAKKAVARRQEDVAKADEAQLLGERMLGDRDYEGAVDQFRTALKTLPAAPVTEDRRKEMTEHFSDAGVKLARQRAEEGRFTEALGIVTDILEPGMAPDDANARQLLEDLNDPEIYSPALTPDHIAKAKEMDSNLKRGQSLLRLGDYDIAEKAYNEALVQDPYNSAARRGLERVEENRRQYYDTAQDQTRSTYMREIGERWELSPPRSEMEGDKSAGSAPAPELARKQAQLPALAEKERRLSELEPEEPATQSRGGKAMVGGGLQGVDEDLAIAPVIEDPEPEPGLLAKMRDGFTNWGFFGRGKEESSVEENVVQWSDDDGSVAGSGGTVELRAGQSIPQSLPVDAAANLAYGEPSSGASREISGEIAVGKELAKDSDRVAGDSSESLGRFHIGATATFGEEVPVSKSQAQNDSKELRPDTKPVPASAEETNAADEPFSTFSLNVSDVSFKLALDSLKRQEWPDASRIRVEEFVNAFDYGDPSPGAGEKVACNLEQVVHPYLQQRNLLRISMRTAAAGRNEGTPLRLTVLLDNSGSMERPDRQEAVQRAFWLLADQLQPMDHVTLIGFARTPRLLAQTSGEKNKQLTQIVATIPSQGGTNLEQALLLAWEKAKEQKIAEAQNRVILLTDGAANLGDADPERLSSLIERMRRDGIAFDAAGVGAEGLNDEILEALTRKGDGRYYLLNKPEDADEGFAKQIAGALRPAAMNVKVQVEFNPERVGNYKLLGFEKHLLKKEDFRDDTVDAAELAAEEAGVALYQVEPMPDGKGDIGFVSVRFKDMSSGEMVERRWPIPYDPSTAYIDQASPSVRLASAAALFASRLKGEPLGELVQMRDIARILASLPGPYQESERVQEFREMVNHARAFLQE